MVALLVEAAATTFGALTTEAALVAASVAWCGAGSSHGLGRLSSLLTLGLLADCLFPEPSELCRSSASPGLALGTLVLPTLFAVQADVNVVLSVAFRLTWWSGLYSAAARGWACWLRPRLGAARAAALAALGCAAFAGGAALSGDALLLPALAVFAAALGSVQAAMPRSFTAGEAVIVAELSAVLFHVILFSILLDAVPLLVLRSKLRKVIAIGLFSAIGISAANLLLARALLSPAARGARAWRGCWHTAMTVSFVAVMLEWMSFAIGENSLLWLWEYITSHTATPLKFIVYYLAVLVPGLTFAPASRAGCARQVILRKYFHVLALIIFVPTILVNIRFMALAFAVGIAVLVVLESLRVSDVPLIVAAMDPFMKRYMDKRDQGAAVLTHIYLLVGCALPVFFAFFVMRGVFSASSLLIALSGVTVTGLGDAAASLCGTNYGRHPWHGSKKTMEGTLAMIVAVLSFQVCCLCAVGFHGLSVASWARLAMADVLVAMLEARTDQIDNLFLPLYHVALLQLV